MIWIMIALVEKKQLIENYFDRKTHLNIFTSKN